MVDRVPGLLTVEEAARVLRVGRTKAYAMAREWRATGGRSGLPVINFGHVLRVPLCQLEALIGGPLTGEGIGADAPARSAKPPEGAVVTHPGPASITRRAQPRSSRRRTGTPDQPTLPFAG